MVLSWADIRTSSYKVCKQVKDLRLSPGANGKLWKCFEQCLEQREMDDDARLEAGRPVRRLGLMQWHWGWEQRADSRDI